MHRQLSEIEKFDIKNPCKDDRKKLMKKTFNDYESDDEYNQCIKKRKTESKINKRSKMTKAGTLMQQRMLSNIKKQTTSVENVSKCLLLQGLLEICKIDRKPILELL
ncbi:PREDICTED: uncharacterized protein LOC105559415 [Vollenhovia emeryi]|uniref:uncharacterized protein LOC105559415 n=1 Tax=Vollenhovia emeryi TaxID=411798 RepID=UPI0005F3869C|nr:PREDICTED: uncharacterized protein LOC105559415 [Vollenhovia emeryi]